MAGRIVRAVASTKTKGELAAPQSVRNMSAPAAGPAAGAAGPAFGAAGRHRDGGSRRHRRLAARCRRRRRSRWSVGWRRAGRPYRDPARDLDGGSLHHVQPLAWRTGEVRREKPRSGMWCCERWGGVRGGGDSSRQEGMRNGRSGCLKRRSWIVHPPMRSRLETRAYVSIWRVRQRASRAFLRQMSSPTSPQPPCLHCRCLHRRTPRGVASWDLTACSVASATPPFIPLALACSNAITSSPRDFLASASPCPAASSTSTMSNSPAKAGSPLSAARPGSPPAPNARSFLLRDATWSSCAVLVERERYRLR